MTTEDLTKAGLKWLKVQWRGGEDFGHPGCSVIAMDKMSLTGERPDLIGWSESRSTLIETKLTRADFFRDSSKVWRMYGPGMGQIRWYLTPKGLVKPEEVPYAYGLLEFDGAELTVAVNAMNRGHYYDVEAERSLLLSIVRQKATSESPKQTVAVGVDTTLSKLIDILGWQGGTIHDALSEVLTLVKFHDNHHPTCKQSLQADTATVLVKRLKWYIDELANCLGRTGRHCADMKAADEYLANCQGKLVDE